MMLGAMRELTDKQRRFAWEYCVDQNATQAALRAGYRDGNIGRQLMTKNNVRAAVDERLAKIDERTRVDAEKVRTELARLAFTDMRSFVKWGPDGVELLPSDGLSEDDSPAVTEVTQSPGQYGDTLKIKLGHKDSALRLLAEHTGLVGKDGASVNVNVNVDNRPAAKPLNEWTEEELEFYERILDPGDGIPNR